MKNTNEMKTRLEIIKEVLKECPTKGIYKVQETKKEIKLKNMNLKKGQRVMIEEWIVADQSDGEILTTTGEICSNVSVHKVQGYENEYNGYVKVKLACGNVLSFNWHELNCK